MSTTAPGLRLGAIALGLVLSLVAQSDRGSIVGIATDSRGGRYPASHRRRHEYSNERFPRDAQHRKRK